MNGSNAVTEEPAMRTLAILVFALLLACLAPTASYGGGHFKKLHELHAAHSHKHKMKKAMKAGCQNCGDQDGGGGKHGHLHGGLHHKK
jgi:hypothetical protein